MNVFATYLASYYSLTEDDVAAGDKPGEFKIKSPGTGKNPVITYRDNIRADPFRTWKRFRRTSGSTETFGRFL